MIHVLFPLNFFVFVLFSSAPSTFGFNFSDINLPEKHLPFYFSSLPSAAQKCKDDPDCPYKKYLDKNVCWGYEPGCKSERSFKRPLCTAHHQGWVKSKEAQIETFYSQGDFGYIRDRSRELKIMCAPMFRDDSSLECSDHLRFCRGRNLMVNLTGLADRKEPLRYNMDVLSEGQVGGYCSFHEDRLKSQCDQLSPLQSWGPELRNFVRLQERPLESNKCDVIVDKPTYILKIDAAVNMYHHFCDFFNLYASMHLNASHLGAFSTDVHILIWETYTYTSTFSEAFKAFSRHPVWDLKSFRGDVVCFKHAVFPLLPRMIFGLYYNTPIIYGCEGSGLFQSFSEFMLHRLGVPERNSLQERLDSGVNSDNEERSSATDDNKSSTAVEEQVTSKPNPEEGRGQSLAEPRLRITLLSRDTTYRKIINENVLLEAIRRNPQYLVKRVVYNRHTSLAKQLELTHHTDVFIGMHGAGLTHLLFLPDWAVIFELYNCEDENCYKDLARLRGVKYMTWQNSDKMQQQDQGHHPNGGAHAKFTNYSFDEDEFSELVGQAAEYVKQHPAYQAFLNSTTTTTETIIVPHDEL